MVLGCKDIHKSYGVDIILDKVSFNLEDNQKAAIVGVNGAGKTTLFKILTGEISKDSGEIFMPKGTKVGYLAQNPVLEGTETIYNELLQVFRPILDMEQKLRDMEQKMSHISGTDLDEHMALYSKLQEEFEKLDGYSYKSRIKGILKGLGFTEDEYDNPINQLSGGQKTRVYLGRLLLTKPDILFLDEPTNHLDIESIQWLEDFLRGYEGAVLIISHDRYFMDRIVTKVIEIENKKSYVYEGNYSFYSHQKELNREIQLKQYENQQKEIKKQQEVIKTLRSFNREKSIKRAESREKSLEKMEKLDKPENLPEKMRLRIEPKISSGNDVLCGENLSKSYDGVKIFENVSFDIKREDKVAIIGPNGVGKSTLFKMLMGQVSGDSGNIRIGANVNIGYYDQEQQNLHYEKTIFQEIADEYPTMTNGEIRSVLASFVFTGDDINKPISALSGGEKGRVALAKIMLSNANVLMLDEPTNHLDMFSKEILEDALNNYTGTIIYISHDRYFIEKTAQKIFELTPAGINVFLGNYSYYLEKKRQNKLIQEELMSEQNKDFKEEIILESATKLDWKAQKQEQAKLRKAINKITSIEKEIEKIETKIKELEDMLFDDKISSDSMRTREIFEEKVKHEERLDHLMEEWEELQS